MSSADDFLPPDLADQLGGMFRKTMASVQDMLEERYQYKVTDDLHEVNDLAAQEGWTVAQVCAAGEGYLMFLLHRKLGAADAAAALLRGTADLNIPAGGDDTPDVSQ